VLVPAALAVLTNFGLSIWFAHEFGLVGVFLATAFTAAALLVPLIRPALRATGATASDFLGQSLRPAVVPALAASLGAAAGYIVDPPLGQLLLGSSLGVLAWATTTWRLALSRAEREELRTSLVGH
jgi:hypothetical protein